MFTGSDHGVYHILEGNMNFANKMIDSLGDGITSKDKVLIHQIITDHDIGYTLGIASAKESFNAQKDHPLFSARYIEENQDYYRQKFGEDGCEAIFEGIINHSNVKSEYPSKDQIREINPDTIRSITSTVDALGVTAETKCPEFFRGPKAIEILQKVKLYADTHKGEISSGVLESYKDQLRKVADKEPSERRKEEFYEAVEKHFNLYKAETTLGQFTGVIKDIKLIEKKGKVIPEIKIDISRIQALLGNLFGEKISINAFVKAMEDFGVPKEKIEDIGKTIRQVKKSKTKKEKENLKKKLKFEGNKAIFEFSPEFNETSPEIERVMEKFEKLSIRGEIRELAQRIKSPDARTSENIGSLLNEFNTAISEKTTI